MAYCTTECLPVLAASEVLEIRFFVLLLNSELLFSWLQLPGERVSEFFPSNAIRWIRFAWEPLIPEVCDFWERSMNRKAANILNMFFFVSVVMSDGRV